MCSRRPGCNEGALATCSSRSSGAPSHTMKICRRRIDDACAALERYAAVVDVTIERQPARSARRAGQDHRRARERARVAAAGVALQRPRAARRDRRAWQKRWPAARWPPRWRVSSSEFNSRPTSCRAISSERESSINGRAALRRCSVRFLPTSCSPTRSIAPRPRCSPRCSKRCRSVK